MDVQSVVDLQRSCEHGLGLSQALSALTALANLNLGGCRSLEGGALERLAPLKALRDLSLHDCARLPCIDAGLSTLTTLAGVSMLNLQVSLLWEWSFRFARGSAHIHQTRLCAAA